jgi:hypothetical protein
MHWYLCHAQNNVAERKHHHLLETAQALLLSSFIPPKFWVEVIFTVVYLVNIHPSTALHVVSPLQSLTIRLLSQSSVSSLVMTLSVRGIVVGIRLLIAFGFPVMLPSMSLIVSSPMLTPLMRLLTFLTCRLH